MVAIAEPVVHEGSHEGSLQRLIGVRALALTAMNTTVGAGIFGFLINMPVVSLCLRAISGAPRCRSLCS